MSGLSVILVLLCLASLGGRAADVVILKSGERKPCTVTGGQSELILALIQPVAELPPVPIRIRKDQTASVEFGPVPDRETLINEATKAQIPQIRNLWNQFSPLLEVRGAPSARIGLRLGLLLLDPMDADSSSEALGLFSLIANRAALSRDREAAEQGRLRAYSAQGRPKEAVAAAEEILQRNAGGNLCAEARLTIAAALEAALSTHVEENPRWMDDDTAGRERTRLYHAALDYYLLPAVLPDITPDLAIRGLSGALRIHQQCSTPALAAEAAKDLIALYPGSAQANDAASFLATLPADIRAQEGANPTQQNSRLGSAHKTTPELYEESNASVPLQNTLDYPNASAKRRKRSRDGNK